MTAHGVQHRSMQFLTSVTQDVPHKYGQVRRLRHNPSLIHHVADKAAVIGGVIDDMQQHLLATHDAWGSTDEIEMDNLFKIVLLQVFCKIPVPLIHLF